MRHIDGTTELPLVVRLCSSPGCTVKADSYRTEPAHPVPLSLSPSFPHLSLQQDYFACADQILSLILTKIIDRRSHLERR
ncbi:hypothetical protein BaRGS_00033450 [Batillaria attramentaria]|uniref:Uncharacterized protein n=1 Tax=Batillaria attramentaria TaxID=370345 RepID=A0ABD0JKQ4_9CAEN